MNSEHFAFGTKARVSGVPQGGTAKFLMCRSRVYTILPFYFFPRGSQNPFPDTGFRAVRLKCGEGVVECQGAPLTAERFAVFFVEYSMNPSEDDIVAERQLIGEWTISTPREGLEYTFEPQHRFTVKILKAGAPPSSAWGYWDVLQGKLRIGTSAEDCDGMPIKVEGERLTMFQGDKAIAVYTRRSAGR